MTMSDYNTIVRLSSIEQKLDMCLSMVMDIHEKNKPYKDDNQENDDDVNEDDNEQTNQKQQQQSKDSVVVRKRF